MRRDDQQVFRLRLKPKSALTLSNKVLLVGVDPVVSLEVWSPVTGDSRYMVAVRGAIGQLLLLQQHATEHATLLSDALCQSPRVHAVHGGNALLLEPCSKRGSGQVVRVVLARV